MATNPRDLFTNTPVQQRRGEKNCKLLRESRKGRWDVHPVKKLAPAKFSGSARLR